MSSPSRTLFLLIIALTVFGLIMVGSASVVAADQDFGNKWYYLRQQAVWATLGISGLVIASRFPHQKLQHFAKPLFLVTIFLLIMVLVPGIGSKLLGARRWLNLGLFSFQPAEFAKLSMVIYFASLYAKKIATFPFVSITGLVAGLIMLEPDMGTTLVITGTSTLMYFGSGGKLKNLLSVVPLLAIFMVLAIIISPYRMSRVKTFFDSSHDPLGASYQVRQSLISLGSGGFIGTGIGESRQKYEFLPEVTTDSIFAIIGEELGTFGTITILIIFAFLTIGGLQIAATQSNNFSKYLALGIASWFGLQAFINMSAVVALLPFTGIPLLFISYGGTSLLITLISSGILINIAKRNE